MGMATPARGIRQRFAQAASRWPGGVVRFNESPNHTARRDGLKPSLVVLHYTAMHSAQAALERLCDPLSGVSAHYLIAADGTVTRMVDEAARAWHAGAGEWCGLGDINSRSIGIELDNRGTHPFSAPQMDALETLLRGIMARWHIAPQGVIAHSDMAPGRKVDPGPHFDWSRLARQGLAARAGQLVHPPAPDWHSFRVAAQAAGYSADAPDEAMLEAVRLRFRPFASGPLSTDDYAPLGQGAQRP